MVQVGVHEAKGRLSGLVRQALAGEDVVITRNGRHAVRLVPIVEAAPTLQTIRGAWAGRVRIADDFDDLPDDVAGALGLG